MLQKSILPFVESRYCAIIYNMSWGWFQCWWQQLNVGVDFDVGFDFDIGVDFDVGVYVGVCVDVVADAVPLSVGASSITWVDPDKCHSTVRLVSTSRIGWIHSELEINLLLLYISSFSAKEKLHRECRSVQSLKRHLLIATWSQSMNRIMDCKLLVEYKYVSWWLYMYNVNFKRDSTRQTKIF